VSSVTCLVHRLFEFCAGGCTGCFSSVLVVVPAVSVLCQWLYQLFEFCAGGCTGCLSSVLVVVPAV
jgi:hypothetical protein